MIVARSLLFSLVFYLNTIVMLIAAIPTFLLPRRAILRVAQAWARVSLLLLRVIVGTRVEYRGLDRIPAGGLLVASKHQSFADIHAILPKLHDPTFILKRELTWIPLFGWFTIKAGMIPVDRSRGASAITDLNRRARHEAACGRQILIYPEGTRRAPGAEPAYKQGVAHLYRSLGVPCLPVALNSGLFWPRRRFVLQPGTMVVEFLDPIPPGLEKDEFMAVLRERIETASNRLLAEAKQPAGYTGPEGI
ncbi:lysophospholipid acyltransferase family protein [Enterovirga aerilata]|uniref:1-acyl-sn-glycerol-3-phosphate acyltransferase n=1 Tax=Enterovirga aerilata TaxID=2730920 RepID=A0A849HW86_9HYPH|nr:1-acyl-sn-glycerol-3-phosphate acyltransferase [Enterovirga sp. DB1703]NNM71362.1 1-acyl-sn-glycerol-3-phosphate acyltransferase [Enterovirga sp. DB1703]